MNSWEKILRVTRLTHGQHVFRWQNGRSNHHCLAFVKKSRQVHTNQQVEVGQAGYQRFDARGGPGAHTNESNFQHVRVVCHL